MDELLASIAAKKERLDAMRPLSRAALLALQKSYDVDLTYTSNAIEGNTLTLRETAELIEHGITVGGKPLRDHLEAVDHYAAVLWVRELAAKATPIDETTVRGRCYLHGLNGMPGSLPDLADAGVYEDLIVKVDGEWRFARRNLTMDGSQWTPPSS